MRVHRYWPVALVVAVFIAGCAGTALDDGQPPKPPTAEQVTRIVEQTSRPAYWLGPRYRDAALSSADVTQRGASMTYGGWSCDSGSCSPTGGVVTRRRDIRLPREDLATPGVDLKKCWTRVGEAVAVLLGCDPEVYEQELQIYTGATTITVSSIYVRGGRDEVSARTVVRRLRPLNRNAPWPLERPEPLSCREQRRVTERYRRHMPSILRPTTRC